MSRKKSIPDSVSAGRSRIVPYYRGEDFRMRHARRLSANLEVGGQRSPVVWAAGTDANDNQ